jgi:hypothetical protein
MGFPKRLSLAVLVIAILPFGPATAEPTIDPFYGRWIGKGITENVGIASAEVFVDRDLDVTIEPTEDGFTIVWKTSRTTKKNGASEVRLWSITVPFVDAERGGLYRMVFPTDPVTGTPYMWARVADRTLVVNSMTISEDGVLEHQKYVRTLATDDEMRLRYTRSLDGNTVRSVLGVLTRE